MTPKKKAIIAAFCILSILGLLSLAKVLYSKHTKYKRAGNVLGVTTPPVDVNGDVVVPNTMHATILGPLLPDGSGNNPWAYFDDRNKALGDLLIQKLAGTSGTTFNYVNYWNAPFVGTVTATISSSTITGIGTSFTTDFCQGPASPTVPKPNNAAIVIWYPSTLLAGTFGRRAAYVSSCQSNTQLTLSSPFGQIDADGIVGGSGLHYSYEDDNLSGPWVYGPAPANYYDNVVGLYALYYRTGDSSYLTAARSLADSWWTFHNIDQGNSLQENNGTFQVNGYRNWNVLGLLMREFDNPPNDMWTGFRVMEDHLRYFDLPYCSGNMAISGCPIGDVRENSYQLLDSALFAYYEPNSARASLMTTYVDNAMKNTWEPNHRANGQFEVVEPDASSWGGNGLTTVTHGSATVTNSSGWGSTTVGDGIWFYNTGTTEPADNSQGDPISYTVSAISGNTLTLNTSYQGTSGSNRGFETSGGCCSVLLGWGTQPFMMGINAEAMHWVAKLLASSDPATAAIAKQYELGAANWLKNYGYDPSDQGIYTGRGFVNCEQPGGLGPSSACASSKDLDSEPMNAVILAYEDSASSTLASFGDVLFDDIYAKPGMTTRTPNSNYVSDLENGQFMYSGLIEQKWFGLFFGIGANYNWPAVRLLPTAAPLISSFTASPSSITSGLKTTLSWTIASATSVSIDNGLGAQQSLTSGSVQVSPTQTTTYTITASNSIGTNTVQNTVTVTTSNGSGSSGNGGTGSSPTPTPTATLTTTSTPAGPTPTAAQPTPTLAGLSYVPGTNPTLPPLPFTTGSLVLDGHTIYYISGQYKIPFTSMAAFTGLGYRLNLVVKGETSAYINPVSYLLSSPTQEHPWGSWLTKDGTVYYLSDKGFIPVPSLDIFTSNGGQLKNIVKMSKTELLLLPKQTLPIMIHNDSRVTP